MSPSTWNCAAAPFQKEQLIEVVCATLAGRKPNLPTYSVCLECKRIANTCVLVACGPPPRPRHSGRVRRHLPLHEPGLLWLLRPHGENSNAVSLAERLASAGTPLSDIERLFRTYNAWAWQFRKVSEEVHPQ